MKLFRLPRWLVAAAVAWRRGRALRIGVAEIIRPVRAVAAAAMTPAPAMPEAILAVALVVAVLPIALIVILPCVLLRLPAAAGDERG